MAMDMSFISGLIAVRERKLLGDRISRMCDMTAEDAFRLLTECSFGGVEAEGAQEYERLVAADEGDIDDFIRRYSPGAAESDYLLAPRDFHNAKAFVKARLSETDVEAMLAPEGTVSVETMRKAFDEGDFSSLPAWLQEPILEATEEGREYQGAEIGAIFDKAEYRHLASIKKPKVLRKLVSKRADMTNILTVFRARTMDEARKLLVEGGELSDKDLEKIASDQADGGDLKDFVSSCREAKAEGKPLSKAEAMQRSFELKYLAATKYDLKSTEPFLYYVFRRRAENEDVRIVMSSLLAHIDKKTIRGKLRSC